MSGNSVCWRLVSKDACQGWHPSHAGRRQLACFLIEITSPCRELYRKYAICYSCFFFINFAMCFFLLSAVFSKISHISLVLFWTDRWWPAAFTRTSHHLPGPQARQHTSVQPLITSLGKDGDITSWDVMTSSNGNFLRYWPCVRGIHRWQVDSPHKGEWLGALMFSLICAWTNGWANNRDAGDFRYHCAHYKITVI